MYGLGSGQRLPVTQDGQSAGDSVEVARLTVGPAKLPPSVDVLDIQHRTDANWGSLCLVGYSLHRLGSEHEPKVALHPGDVAKLVLFWRKEAATTPGDRFVVALTDRRGHCVWEHALQVTGGAFPLTAWRDGEVVRDLHQLHLPAGLRPGAYRLALRADGWGGNRGRHLGRVTVRR